MSTLPPVSPMWAKLKIERDNAMMDYRPEEVKKDIETHFMTKVSEMSKDQVMVMVDLARHVRGRCRSNKALTNYLGQCFPHLLFKLVPERDERTGKVFERLVVLPQNLGQKK